MVTHRVASQGVLRCGKQYHPGQQHCGDTGEIGEG
jgi:hypothetical protein